MSPFPIAAAATVLSRHHNKEDAIAVLKVKLAPMLSNIHDSKFINYRIKLKNSVETLKRFSGVNINASDS